MEDPAACPYKFQKGEKVRSGSKAVASVSGPDIEGISIHIPDQSIFGLSQEYLRRSEEIDELEKERDSRKRGTKEWSQTQARLIQAMERLRSWMDGTLYSRAAKKYAREIEGEMKAAREASAQRFGLAKASIKAVDVPEEFTRVAKEVYGDAVVFRWQESQHARIAFREDLGVERIRALLELVENLIEGFRVLFVDPYIAEDFEDYIPEERFVEWFFGPEDIATFEPFCLKYYGARFPEGPSKEARMRLTGHNTRRAKVFIGMWRIGEQNDLEGIVAHQMGHHLVNVHYNQDRAADVADWLYEGVGNWLSLEYLGRNNVQCIDFQPAKYTKKAADNSEETGLFMGTADTYHRLALAKGPPIDQLALRQLSDFDDPAVAKSFSVFNYVAKTQGEKGQRWLRNCCVAAGARKSFISQWRKYSEELFQVTGVDVFKKINDDWSRFAEEQSGELRRK
jgi:hypothetical protein